MTSAQKKKLAQDIWALLPQTQCQRCGFEDCQSYALSIALENTPINQCPPGGQEGMERLAKLTQRLPEPLNPEFGTEGSRKMAFIDEQWCIGCTLCLDACPTDAIVGTHKSMHTVMESYCTGCELCVPVCPVDCIELEEATPHQSGWSAWSMDQALEAKSRFEKHKVRLDTKALEGPQTHTQAKRLHALDALHAKASSETPFPPNLLAPLPPHSPAQVDKAALLQKALARAQTQKR